MLCQPDKEAWSYSSLMLIDSISQTSQTLKRGHFHPSKQFFRSVNICSVPGEKKNRSVDIFAIIENNGEESWSDKGNPSYCRKCGFTLFRKWMNLPYWEEHFS